jgi:Zn-dependent protease with chaperone function
MHLPFEFLQHAAVPAAQALIAGLWQGIALAVITGLVLRFLPGTTASARFAVWTALFCASAAMPLAHLFTANAASTAVTSSHRVFDPRWSYLLAGIWVGASLFRLATLLAEAASLRKLWREAQPLAPEVLEAAGLNEPQPIDASSRPERSGVERPPHLVSLSRAVQVCSTPGVDRPSVIGFFAPKILIPDWLCDQLSPTELRHIVLHEMEHLRRRDDWLNLLQKIGLVLFPLNPAMFWIDRRLSTEREIACDDGVLARTKTPRAYAASLTSIAERRLNLSARRRMVDLALGAFGTGKLFARRSEFAQRIESILNSVGGQRTAGRPAIAAALVMAIIAGSAAISHAPELVSFGAPSTQNAALNPAQKDTVAKLTVHRPASAPHFENASLRLPVAQPNHLRHVSAIPSIQTLTLEEHPVAAISVKANVGTPAETQPVKRNHSVRQAKPQWLLLSSFEEPSSMRSVQTNRASDFTNDDPGGDVVVPVSRVVLRTPDGRFFATPYAAVPTQAGWLIVQL